MPKMIKDFNRNSTQLRLLKVTLVAEISIDNSCAYSSLHVCNSVSPYEELKHKTMEFRHE
jgi:hypothetical protein